MAPWTGAAGWLSHIFNDHGLNIICRFLEITQFETRIGEECKVTFFQKVLESPASGLISVTTQADSLGCFQTQRAINTTPCVYVFIHHLHDHV